jgi:hypothetical protein
MDKRKPVGVSDTVELRDANNLILNQISNLDEPTVLGFLPVEQTEGGCHSGGCSVGMRWKREPGLGVAGLEGSCGNGICFCSGGFSAMQTGG